MPNNITAACNELLEAGAPEDWTRFLFDLQNNLVSTGYFLDFTRAGCEEQGRYFGALKNFFDQLNSSSQNS